MNTTLLIDGDILLHNAIHAAEDETDWGDGVWTHTVDTRECQAQISAEIRGLVRLLDAQKYVVCLSDHRDNFRKSVLPSYKSNRKNRKPPGYRHVEEWLMEAHPCRWSHRLEADDVLGIMSTNRRLPGRKIIVSIDKDMKTIPGLLYNPMRATEGVVEISRDEADRWHMMQTLAGDSTDCYAGCPGVGMVKAERLLEGVKPRKRWEAVVSAFEACKKADLTEEDALVQARVARILRHGEYNQRKRKVKLWTPPKSRSKTS